MSRVVPVIIFGFTLVVGGMYWMLWDGSREYLDNILIEDVYYTFMYWGWRAIPVVIILVGIMCMISAAITSRNTNREVF